MRLTLTLLLAAGAATYVAMGETTAPATTYETVRAGAKVVHLSPQQTSSAPTFEASVTCWAVLGAIDYAQKHAGGRSDLAQMQEKRRLDAAVRAKFRNSYENRDANMRSSQPSRNTGPDGRWAPEPELLRRQEMARDPFSRLKDSACANCGGFLDRLKRGAMNRCGLTPG